MTEAMPNAEEWISACALHLLVLRSSSADDERRSDALLAFMLMHDKRLGLDVPDAMLRLGVTTAELDTMAKAYPDAFVRAKHKLIQSCVPTGKQSGSHLGSRITDGQESKNR
ncbi:MAG: hypothetical protein KBC38_03110 [Candidatus Pacebacteria bacterium]|nr:hypothetical protein [Candidatus Paceibacterota bacterium]MBP9840600.1 hypothetical protein [Candidatus Paceibacterota bacterium]